MDNRNNVSMTWAPALGRLLMSVLFLASGIGKLMAPAATIAYIASAGLPLPAISYGAAAFVEVVGGALLLVGYRARPVAAVLCLFTLAAAAFFHNHFADQNQLIHFLKNLAIAGGLLQVVAFGSGAWSLDARRR